MYLRRDAGLLGTNTGRKGWPETLLLACGRVELAGVFESMEVIVSVVTELLTSYI